MEATHTATLRHTHQLLPLLPSGPGGVHDLALRRDRVGHHRAAYASGIHWRKHR